MNLNGTEYYYIRNAQGDIIGLFDGAGTQVVSYIYDSWGKLISTIGSLASTVGVNNPYRYRGYRYDTETGLDYLQSRHYNPYWGRFVNVDGLVGKTGELLGHNMFAYCSNNPVNMNDSNGTFALAIPLIIGLQAIVDALTVVIGGTIIAESVIRESQRDESKADTRAEPRSIPKEDINRERPPVIFPEYPIQFNPRGLERNYYPGTSNGMIIKWLDPASKYPIFDAGSSSR